ncbi:MAG: FkbM family methyltransferase [Sphingomonadales bacterium]|nr:FkbM family methyltransferase [Sphingomonadales bacterium]
MVSLKRQIYGLPLLKAYRLWRARQIARRPRPVREGFSFASYDMAFTEDWERAERALVARMLPDCAALVDVGANSGFYALLAVHAGKPALAIEPDAGNLVLLRANTRGKPVEIVAAALSDAPGTVSLYGDGDMASFDPRWQGVGTHFRQSVPAMTLDALLAARWPAERLLIKVDVEGAEALVLRGAKATLAREPRPCWLIETLDHLPTGAANPSHGEVLAIMQAAGYSAEEVSPGNLFFA